MDGYGKRQGWMMRDISTLASLTLHTSLPLYPSILVPIHPPTRVTLPNHPAPENLQAIVSDYETMLISVMRAIVNRYERNTEYPFIDTKLDLITGEDFLANDPIRGKNAIYGWIQGRGLEALAGVPGRPAPRRAGAAAARTPRAMRGPSARR